MIRRVYIAAPYPLKAEAIELRRTITQFGIAVTSRWLDYVPDANRVLKTEADFDLTDVRIADALVLLNPEKWANIGTGGRHVEVGYAVALGIPVFVIGAESNVFHHLAGVRICANDVVLMDALLHAAPKVDVRSHGDHLTDMCRRVHLANQKWWVSLVTGKPIERNVGELLMLTTSELAEAMEGHRKDLPDDKLPHRSMFEVELADAIIRIFDICGGMNVDLGGAFEEKMAFNAVREDHTTAHRLGEHGKKY